MPLQRSPPPPATEQLQPPTTPSTLFSTPQPLLFTPHSSSEPNLNTNSESPSNNASPAITFRNIKRKRLEDDENNKLAAFMTEMKQMLLDFKEQHDTKYESLCTMVDNMRSSFELMGEKFDRLSARVENLEEERKENTSYIHKLESKLEHFEQSSRSTCLEIRNIPVVPSESKSSLLNTVLNTGVILNFELQPNDVKDVFRVKSKDPANKTIIVDFTTVLRKEAFLANFKKHNKESFKITTEHLKINGPVKPIFISENLSAKNKRLFFLARDAAKSNEYKFCWIKHGKIFVREKEGSKHLQIRSEADLSIIAKPA